MVKMADKQTQKPMLPVVHGLQNDLHNDLFQLKEFLMGSVIPASPRTFDSSTSNTTAAKILFKSKEQFY